MNLKKLSQVKDSEEPAKVLTEFLPEELRNSKVQVVKKGTLLERLVEAITQGWDGAPESSWSYIFINETPFEVKGVYGDFPYEVVTNLKTKKPAVRWDAEDEDDVYDDVIPKLEEYVRTNYGEDAKIAFVSPSGFYDRTSDAQLSSQGEIEAKQLFEQNSDLFTAWSQFKPTNPDSIIASDEGQGFDPNNQRTDFKTGTPPIDLARLCVWNGITDREEIITYAAYYLGDGWFK